ncbi:carbohydrate kinase [Egicoccus sp. AB-alg6-2]|uniref:carbohydrate kinase family protein n=1 Tax=Egicoccus sp. AB-alg6-2 TaxID=3242692 RepID=UPI00359EABED
MIVVVGEALVDLAPAPGEAADARHPLPGGSPYNVAVGLGRLGSPTAYVGCLSRDPFGEQLATRLGREGVSLRLATRTDAPTTLAVVHLDDQGRASYGFYLTGTSAAELGVRHLDGWDATDAVHVSLGAITLTTPHAGAAVTELLSRDRGDGLRSLDPNVRPTVIDDLQDYGARLEQLVPGLDLVKVSDEDLRLLHPDQDPVEVAHRWAQNGPAAVVVTRGPDGAEAHLASGEVVEVAGLRVEVVDTVGAGDAFTAGLLHALEARSALSRAGLEVLDVTAWREALQTAVRVAAITCTRPGADPPRADEL